MSGGGILAATDWRGGGFVAYTALNKIKILLNAGGVRKGKIRKFVGDAIGTKHFIICPQYAYDSDSHR